MSRESDSFENFEDTEGNRIDLGYNFKQPHDNKEVYLSVSDGIDDVAIGISVAEATGILNHLNKLLGYPLTSPPTAG